MEQTQDKDLVANLSSIRDKKLKVEDKMKVALKLGCSLATIDRYLKGEVKKRGFAKLLVDQFNTVAA